MPELRWTAKRKAEIVAAMRSGEMTLSDLVQHNLSIDELREWITLYDTHGLPALRSTKLQEYRKPKKRTRRRS